MDLAFNAGVGQQDIDPAELLDRSLNILLRLVGPGDISSAIAYCIAPNSLDSFFECILVQINQQDLCAFLGKQPAGLKTDAARPPGDDGNFIIQASHAIPPGISLSVRPVLYGFVRLGKGKADALSLEGVTLLMVEGNGMGTNWKGHYTTSLLDAMGRGLQVVTLPTRGFPNVCAGNRVRQLRALESVRPYMS